MIYCLEQTGLPSSPIVWWTMLNSIKSRYLTTQQTSNEVKYPNFAELQVFADKRLDSLLPSKLNVVEDIWSHFNNHNSGLFIVTHREGRVRHIFNTFIDYVRSTGKSVISVATSGIAACLLTGGHTFHSTCKVPLKIEKLWFLRFLHHQKRKANYG